MPLNINWLQILLHLFNFVVLFAILYFLLYKPVRQFIEKRAAYYKDVDEQAKARLAEAEAAKAAYLEKMDAAEDEISEQRKKAYAELEEANKIQLKRAKEEAAKLISDAHASIEYDRAKMMREAQDEITDMIVNAAEKLVTNSTTAQAYDQFLEAAERGESNG